MKPEEKANELIEKFSYYSFYLEYRDAEEDRIKNAKQCALIAVDEMMKVTKYEYERFNNDRFSENYWKQVKTEIEKL